MNIIQKKNVIITTDRRRCASDVLTKIWKDNVRGQWKRLGFVAYSSHNIGFKTSNYWNKVSETYTNIIKQEGFLPCQTPTYTIWQQVEGCRMEGVGLGEKNEEGCVFGYFSFNMGECYGILCYGYLYFFSI